jgi:hypothetical protein
MKLSELQVDKEYAIATGWTSMHNSPNWWDFKNIDRRDVWKVTLLSLEKYKYTGDSRYTHDENKEKFEKAPKNAKSNIGVLVRHTDNQGVVRYIVTRLSEVIVEWSVIEPIWAEQEALKLQEQLKEKQRHEEIQRKRDNARLHAERAQTNLPVTLKKVLGNLYSNVEVNYSTYSDNPSPTVTLSLRDIERLIELAYDNQEEVA